MEAAAGKIGLTEFVLRRRKYSFRVKFRQKRSAQQLGGHGSGKLGAPQSAKAQRSIVGSTEKQRRPMLRIIVYFPTSITKDHALTPFGRSIDKT
jgi:hypothetical protein